MTWGRGDSDTMGRRGGAVDLEPGSCRFGSMCEPQFAPGGYRSGCDIRLHQRVKVTPTHTHSLDFNAAVIS